MVFVESSARRKRLEWEPETSGMIVLLVKQVHLQNEVGSGRLVSQMDALSGSRALLTGC